MEQDGKQVILKKHFQETLLVAGMRPGHRELGEKTRKDKNPKS